MHITLKPLWRAALGAAAMGLAPALHADTGAAPATPALTTKSEAVMKQPSWQLGDPLTMANGKLTWDVPEGTWTVLRFGTTPTGAVNAPAPESGRGLECDKLSRAGMDAHWAGMIAPMLQDLGPLAGKVLRNLLIDSYEVGHQNWSADFREEFMHRRGYDLLPYLPAMTGRVASSRTLDAIAASPGAT